MAQQLLETCSFFSQQTIEGDRESNRRRTDFAWTSSAATQSLSSSRRGELQLQIAACCVRDIQSKVILLCFSSPASVGSCFFGDISVLFDAYELHARKPKEQKTL